MKHLLPIGLFLVCASMTRAQDSLPPLADGKIPHTLDEMWSGYDPRKEPLETQVTHESERDGVVLRVVVYRVGVFKGAPATVAAYYAFPKGAAKLPGLLHIHGGGQSANRDNVISDAKRGYCSMSINWGGNKMSLSGTEVYAGPQTDWGNLDATHPPQRNPVNHFAGGIAPDKFTLDPVLSPRNDNWFLVVLGARRALTFLEQQPEVDPDKLGVYGHSMGGRLTTELTGIDKRVKAAVPSCGGSGDVLESETHVPGGRRSRLSPLELACTSENPYIARLSVPVLWLSPTNDFHAHIDNMAHTWRNVPDSLLRLSMTPHFNHRHANEFTLTQHLWFEQHLKGAFQMPQTPVIELNLKTADCVPSVRVVPDSSRAVQRVDVYYSNDPHGLTRFWRDAGAVRNESEWNASLPIMSSELPLFVFANVFYETPAEYRSIANPPGQGNAALFAISSREATANPAQLAEANVHATDKAERMIDDGSRGWHDWYRLNADNPSLWTAVTRKLKDPKWRGPDGARLVFEIKGQAGSTLLVKLTVNDWGAFSSGPKAEYVVSKSLTGAGDWQSVSVGLEDLSALDSRVTSRLSNWRTVTELSLSPSGEVMKDGQRERVEGARWNNPREVRVRNLRWEGGEYGELRVGGKVMSHEDLGRGFNDAIKKSVEQEKLDRK